MTVLRAVSPEVFIENILRKRFYLERATFRERLFSASLLSKDKQEKAFLNRAFPISLLSRIDFCRC